MKESLLLEIAGKHRIGILQGLNFPESKATLFLMHSVIDQIIPPNVVNYSRKFSANLSSSSGKRVELLACVKVNFIEVYTVELESRSMKLFSKHTFAARIESIEVLPKPDQISDWIFLTFPDCKVMTN